MKQAKRLKSRERRPLFSILCMLGIVEFLYLFLCAKLTLNGSWFLVFLLFVRFNGKIVFTFSVFRQLLANFKLKSCLLCFKVFMFKHSNAFSYSAFLFLSIISKILSCCQARVQTMSRSCPGHAQVIFRSCTGHLNTISISNLKGLDLELTL